MREFFNIKFIGSWNIFFFIILFLLKVFQVSLVADWAWIWIVSPIWIPICLWVICLGIYALCDFLTNRIK